MKPVRLARSSAVPASHQVNASVAAIEQSCSEAESFALQAPLAVYDQPPPGHRDSAGCSLRSAAINGNQRLDEQREITAQHDEKTAGLDTVEVAVDVDVDLDLQEHSRVIRGLAGGIRRRSGKAKRDQI